MSEDNFDRVNILESRISISEMAAGLAAVASQVHRIYYDNLEKADPSTSEQLKRAYDLLKELVIKYTPPPEEHDDWDDAIYRFRYS